MYFASDSGLVVCVREIGAERPHLLRDPKALPFGYIPPEGLKPTQSVVPGAEPKLETSLEPKEPGAMPDEPKEDAPADEPKGEAPADEPKAEADKEPGL
jgi:hypothetical protein